MPIISGGRIIEGAIKRQPVISAAGAPTANVTGLGTMGVGDQYLNTTNGVLYIVTATNGTSTITFAAVGAQV